MHLPLVYRGWFSAHQVQRRVHGCSGCGRIFQATRCPKLRHRRGSVSDAGLFGLAAGALACLLWRCRRIRGSSRPHRACAPLAGRHSIHSKGVWHGRWRGLAGLSSRPRQRWQPDCIHISMSALWQASWLLRLSLNNVREFRSGPSCGNSSHRLPPFQRGAEVGPARRWSECYRC